MIKAVVFDIDNTLTDDVSWLRITELLGASAAEHSRIFDDFTQRKLSLTDAKRELVELWQATGNTHQSQWQSLIADWPLKEGARELVQFVHDQGYETALITGSFDLFAEDIAKRLNIKHWYANSQLVWDNSGDLIDFDYIRDQAGQKLKDLQRFCEQVGVDIKDCAVVADGDNDIETFKATGKGIAVDSKHPALIDVSWRQASSLKDVTDILRD